MKLTRIFLDADLRCSFQGLRALAKSAKTELKGANVVFMNRRATQIKVLVNDAYCVLTPPSDRRIPYDAIRFMPKQFGGSEAEVSRMVEKSIREKLGLAEGANA